MGISMALLEETSSTARSATTSTTTSRMYHVADERRHRRASTSAWVDEDDPTVNPMGAKGIGEIGIVGTAAAVANAVYHATGVRVRDLPITPAKLVGRI